MARRKMAPEATPTYDDIEVEAISSEGDADDSEASEDSDDGEEEDSEEEAFEDQGSSDEEDDDLYGKRQSQHADGDDDEALELENRIQDYEKLPRKVPGKRTAPGESSLWLHTDDLSSDDEDEAGEGNRIGRVPLHWYDEYDHIGYNAHGNKVIGSSLKKDGLDRAIDGASGEGKFVVHDALNDRDVQLSERQLELIRRVEAGAFAHPEFDANPDYIDYVSGVNKEISGLTSGRIERKSTFQSTSAYERMQVRKLLQELKEGKITLDELKGKTKTVDPNKPYMLWKGDEEDELNLGGKGPQHLPAPKQPPPGHAESYCPPDEYLPTQEDLAEWQDLDPANRPHGLLVPKKFSNLRSVGAYQNAVRETFERCLDLYLCPRSMKRRLNIDPETLVPKLPKAQDLRPFPTTKCLEYKVPSQTSVEMVRCLSPSPDGQYLTSGASDGFVRLWEVQTTRLLASWNVSAIAKSPDDEATLPVVSVAWNPSKSHQCLLVAVGKCIIVIATGTGNTEATAMTNALLTSARKGQNNLSELVQKAVEWKVLPTATDTSGPVVALVTKKEVSSIRWHKKGDYFCSVSPKAGAAAVLIHQLSKANSQQPFRKSKDETQLACFHPNKPFLFVASPQSIRVYHLLKQVMVKRLLSGCRWISSIDVHPSGDHLIVGSLDRRIVWFDLDLGAKPYKTLKYHERALRTIGYHARYPLMASGSDDGSVHVFHSMVYSDLMRNPLIVPVKILRSHAVVNKNGVLSLCFHPTQPWLFTAGADGRIFLFQDI